MQLFVSQLEEPFDRSQILSSRLQRNLAPAVNKQYGGVREEIAAIFGILVGKCCVHEYLW